jgi:hypothetical protein
MAGAAVAIKAALALIRGARENIDPCLTEVKRVLT